MKAIAAYLTSPPQAFEGVDELGPIEEGREQQQAKRVRFEDSPDQFFREQDLEMMVELLMAVDLELISTS